MDHVKKSTIIPSGNNFSVIRAVFLVLLFTVFLYRYVQNRSQRRVLPSMYQKPMIEADAVVRLRICLASSMAVNL